HPMGEGTAIGSPCWWMRGRNSRDRIIVSTGVQFSSLSHRMGEGRGEGNSFNLKPLVTDLQKPHHRITMFEHFLFVPRRDDLQGITFRMTQDEPSAGRQHLRQVLVIEQP